MLCYMEGRVQSVIYSDDAQSFYIFRLKPETLYRITDSGPKLSGSSSHESMTIKGKIIGLGLAPGSWISLKAKEVSHQKYGKQYQIEQAPFIDYWTDASILSLLKSKGVSHYITRGLMNAASKQGVTLRDALKDPILLEDLGLTKEDAESLHETWSFSYTHFRVLSFLQDLKVSPRRVSSIWNHFGYDTEKILTSNPWSLLEINGFVFEEVDRIALKMGFTLSDSDPNRLKGFIHQSINDSRFSGHVYLSQPDLFRRVKSVLSEAPVDVLETCVNDLLGNGKLKLTMSEDKIALYHPWLYRIEKGSAQLLSDRLSTSHLTGTQIKSMVQSISGDTEPISTPRSYPKSSDKDRLLLVLMSMLDKWSEATDINLSKSQRLGVINAVCEPVSIITGLPGTGKTTSLKMVVRLLKDAQVKFLLLAPTGIAAKRITSLTGESAMTIHRAFGAKKIGGGDRKATYLGIDSSSSREASDDSGQVWGHSPDNPHPAEVVIIDESSMVDQHLLYRILYSTRKTCRIVFVGDSAQLPSVGAGNVLADLIKSGLFQTIHLTEIFRQESVSDIIKASHAIHNGCIPSLKGSKEFVLFSSSSSKDSAKIIRQLVTKLYDKRQNFQVLSPRHGGEVGVTNLNNVLRTLLNPKQTSTREVRLGGDTLREEDRIMVVRNDYDLGIYNGDVGKISRIDQKAKEIEIKVHGPPVMFVRIPMGKISSTLRLAYAMTVHKSQGQEYGNIIMPLMDSFGRQLQRNLFYTAVTRAKQRVFIVGSVSAMKKAIKNNKANVRQTFLTERLTLETSDIEINDISVGDIFLT